MKFNGNCITMMDDESLVKCLSRFLNEKCDDYGEVKRCYEEWLMKKKEQLPDAVNERIMNLVESYMSQIASDMMFAYSLGFKANLEHFHYPMHPTMINAEPEVFLKEIVMRTMPKRIEAQIKIDKIHNELKNENIDYEELYEYFAYMETFAGKVAHYQGFIDANRILYLTEPGYTEDRLLTSAYGKFMEKFIGIYANKEQGAA